MEVRQYPRIILRGDEEESSYRIRTGIKQLDILKELMEFQGLKQDTRRVRYINGSEITCRSIFGVDDITIYSPEVEEEEVIKGHRFFAKVRRGGIYGKICFYWITFTGEGDVSTIVVGSAGLNSNGDRIVDVMADAANLSANMKHSATKAFMLTREIDEKPVKERWVALQHILLKNIVQQFHPLTYPLKPDPSILWPGTKAHYPCPPPCTFVETFGLGHPCPVNRFYCNVDEKKMVWYSCYTVTDPYPPNLLIHYCFGIILTITDSMTTIYYESPDGIQYYKITDDATGEELIKTFNCYSSEMDSEGFDPLWYYTPTGLDCIPPDIDPMCGADADVPYQMLTDVSYLDGDKIEIFLPWEERPTKVTVDLTGSTVGTTEDDHTYEAVDETSHWYWNDEGNGFEQRVFCTHEYTDQPGGIVDYSANVVITHTHSGCDCPEVISCSAADQIIKEGVCCCTGCGQGTHVGKFEETNSAQWQRIYWRQSAGAGTHHQKTFYFFYLPSNEVLYMKSWDWEVVTVQGKMGEGQNCHANWVFDHWEGSDACFRLLCEGPGTPGGPAQIRYVGETLKQKLASSLNADWCSPNVVFVGAEKDRVYTDAFRELGNYSRSWYESIQYGGRYYGLENNPAAFASSVWVPAQEYMGPDKCGFPSANSFISYEDPGVLWGSDVTSSSFSRSHSMVDYAYGDPFVSAFCGGASGWFWKRYGVQNTLLEPLVLEYRIEDGLTFDFIKINRTYYLDDRATEDSEGLITAGRGAIIVDSDLYGFPVYDVGYWEVYHDDRDITGELLESLSCEMYELIEIGLV